VSIRNNKACQSQRPVDAAADFCASAPRTQNHLSPFLSGFLQDASDTDMEIICSLRIEYHVLILKYNQALHLGTYLNNNNLWKLLLKQKRSIYFNEMFSRFS